MKITRYLFVLVALMSSCLAIAQTGEDKIVLKAMQDEMDRSMNLQIEKAEKPFLITYYFVRSKNYEVSARLGALMNSEEYPYQSAGGVKVLLGDYDNTSDFDKMLDLPTIPTFEMPMELDYDLIREKYWQHTDIAYKQAVWNQSQEKTRDIWAVDPEDLTVKDLIRVPVTNRIENRDSLLYFDHPDWEKKVRMLSEVFNEYHELFNSDVSVKGSMTDYYMKNSEGITLKQCRQEISLEATVWAFNDDGKRLREKFKISVQNPDEFPPLDTIKNQLRRLAQGLLDYQKAPKCNKYYSGPVLFEGAGALGLLTQISQFAIMPPSRESRGTLSRDLPLAERMNTRILDARLSIKNYTDLKKYKGEKLSGAYEIDAEGVVPPKELILVENGFLRNFLNNRIPRRNFDQATGSTKFAGSAYSIVNTVSPGILHFSVSDGCRPQILKKKLIQAAKAEGLDYAYVVRRVGWGVRPVLYRVDVKDGKETLESWAKSVMGRFDFELRKFRFLEFSKKEIVGGNMIYPSAILVDNYEIQPMQEAGERKPALDYPVLKISDSKNLSNTLE